MRSAEIDRRDRTTVRVKLLASGVTAVAGAAAVGLLGGLPATGIPVISAAVEPVVFGVPMPLDPGADLPGADLPSADQLNGVLYGLADPAVPFAAKAYLVEGGIGRLEARAADGLMQKAVARGQLPLNFAVANITSPAPGVASATVTATGAATPALTQTVTFVDQGGWKLSRASATTVLGMFNG